ncbi:MAG: hypothetical protein WBC78_09815 [Candidatus Sulfotelmatobacter sp.]
MSNKVKSGFLYSDPSFLSGLSRTLDMYGLYDGYNASSTTQEADARALASDWIVVGQDLQDAIDEFQSQLENVA